jgi:hypothetical protein
VHSEIGSRLRVAVRVYACRSRRLPLIEPCKTTPEQHRDFVDKFIGDQENRFVSATIIQRGADDLE